MANKPILKIVKFGSNVNSTDLRDYLFHSDYTMFKLHSVSGGNITINAGEQTGYVDISHSLNYIPAFLVYINMGGTWQLFPTGCRAYITTTGIRVTFDLGSPYNQVTTPYTASQYFYDYPGALPTLGAVVGKLFGSDYASALWFENIYVPQGKTIDSAGFEFKNVRTTSGSDIKFKIFGVDEDNTADLTGGYPGGRPKTDAYRDKTQSPNTNLFNFGDEWKTLVQEIVNRAGWSSGNHMAFMFENNGTADDKVMYFGRSVDEPHGPSLSDLILTITTTDAGSITYPVKVVLFKDKIA